MDDDAPSPSARDMDLCRCSIQASHRDALWRVFWSGRFMLMACGAVFVAAWFLFIFGIFWSNTYYYQYYVLPSSTSNNGTSNATSGGGGGRGPHDVPIDVDDAGAIPSGMLRRHFPMKASHWIPGLMISAAYLCMCGYSFRSADDVDFGHGTEADHNRVKFIWCKDALLLVIAVFSSGGLCIALIFLILLASFVEVNGNKHVAVPTVVVLIQCGRLLFGLALGFLSKWLYFQETIEDPDKLL